MNYSLIIGIVLLLMLLVSFIACLITARAALKIIFLRIAETFPIWYRAGLYFLATFILSMSDKVLPILIQDQWPSAPRWVAGILVGLGAGILAVRAYGDGSAKTFSDAIEAKKKNGFDTSTFSRALSPNPTAPAVETPKP